STRRWPRSNVQLASSCEAFLLKALARNGGRRWFRKTYGGGQKPAARRRRGSSGMANVGARRSTISILAILEESFETIGPSLRRTSLRLSGPRASLPPSSDHGM